MDQKRITTALNPAVGAAAEQSSSNMYASSIADPGSEINGRIAEKIPVLEQTMENAATDADVPDEPELDFQEMVRRMTDLRWIFRSWSGAWRIRPISRRSV